MRILIVGGGIAGLAVARTLARASFAAEVVEREPTWDGGGLGIYLPGNASVRCEGSASSRRSWSEES
jgi:2-polyprenyl-6-methoxyphenol hydroxylase-like FAD-dependent oxidoreductase